MTNPASPAKRPGRGWYAVAAVLAALAVAIGAVLAVWIIRALVGYEVTTFRAGEPVTIVLQDRGEAIWVSPENDVATCHTTDGDQGSFGPGTADRMTITDGGYNWSRVGILKGEPGSEHTLVCGDGGTAQVFGHAPNPRIGRYVTYGVAGGLVAGLAIIAAFVIVPVVAVKRNRKPQST
jgi:hypothetical protein